MLSFTGARWIAEPPDRDAVDLLARQLDVPRLLAAALRARGLDASGDAAPFLRPSMDYLHDPMEMLGMGKAVARIRRAVERGEHVRVVTDYDVDGITSSVILQATIAILGGTGKLDYHVPDRFSEGYGFSVEAARRAAEDGVTLLITADLGVRDHEAVATAARGGADVIVCDHHLADGAGVPEHALAVLCPPQEGCSYPNPSLAACGITFKLAQALLADHPHRQRLVESLLKPAAIGTVADMVSLADPENRAIVTLGLDALTRGPNASGLDALLATSGCRGRHLGAGDVGFKMAPRLNAAGRMERATLAVDLLLERDPEKAQARARELNALNRRRQTVEKALVQRIMDVVEERRERGSLLFPVFAGREEDGWHPGVLGIVAGRLKEALNLPVAVASISGDMAAGSIRTPPGVDAVVAMDSARDLFTRHGGHPRAGGFSLPASKLTELEAALQGHAAGLDPSEHVPTHRVDLDTRLLGVAPGDLDLEAAALLERLGPFGSGNPRPRLLLSDVYVPHYRCSKGEHVFFTVDGLGVVWWGGAGHGHRLADNRVDLLGTLQVNRWRDTEEAQFVVTDARDSAPLP